MLHAFTISRATIKSERSLKTFNSFLLFLPFFFVFLFLFYSMLCFSSSSSFHQQFCSILISGKF